MSKQKYVVMDGNTAAAYASYALSDNTLFHYGRESG